MVVKVYGIDGSEQRNIDLADEVFNRSISNGSIYHAIRNELANLRAGTASTKTRSEVRGSGTKPWRQKGTGRARAGTRQSPVWVGGGVAFGPKPRDYSYKIPKKLKRLAFKSIFSQKTQEERLLVVEDFTVESGKTKELVKILKGLTPENRTAIVISGEDSMLKRAGRNIPGLSILSYNRLRAHDLFYAGRVIIFEKAAESLSRMYGEPSSRRRPGKAPVGAKTREGAKPVALEKPKPAAPKKAAPKKGAPEAANDGSKPSAPKAAVKAKPAGTKTTAKAPGAGTKTAAAAPAAKPKAAAAKTAAKPKAKTQSAAAKPPAAKSTAAKPPAAKSTAKPKGTGAAAAPTAKSKPAAAKTASKTPSKAKTDSSSSRQADKTPTAKKPAAPKSKPKSTSPGKTGKKDA
jgi:large subunit ribosomal protein L4